MYIIDIILLYFITSKYHLFITQHKAMKHLLRNAPLKNMARSSVPAYNPEANDQKTK